ncbi:MAG TPA: O-antigen ligase family protein [Parvibaculum sp.]
MDGWDMERRGGAVTQGRSWAARAGDLLMFAVVAVSFYQKSNPGQNQPVPFDILLVAAMAVYFLFGLKLPRGMVWPAVLWGLILAGYGIGGMAAAYLDRVENFMPAAAYLVCAMIFFAAYVYEEPERRLKLIFNAYTVAAVIAAFFGVGGYLGFLPNADSYLDFGRATGTFNDPNVFGPFLIAPAIYLSLRLSKAQSARALFLAPLVCLLVLGILFSFSRGAWGNFLFSSAIFVGLSLATSRSPQQSLRLIIFSALMGLLVVAIVGVALSTPKIQRLFTERAALVQDYDVGQQGRFESQKRAIVMSLERPLGIGPGQWGMVNKLDTHNVYLNVLVAGGFLSGLSFLTFLGVTFRRGGRAVLVAGPGQEYLIVLYACIVGHMAEAFIIDVDNWRHLFLLFGMAWGAILVAEQARGRASGAPPAIRRQPRIAEPADGFPA